jgi:hypothetical protein
MDALADLMEFMVDQQYSSPPTTSRPWQDLEDMIEETHFSSVASTALVSPRRFQQTRFIMGVEDEASFQANISTLQLYSIESKELLGILQELALAIALQRFRFVDRLVAVKTNNNNRDNDYGVCHCLARILTAVCRGYSKVIHSIQWMDQQKQQQQQGQGDNSSTAAAATVLPQHIPPSAASGCLDFLAKCCGPQQPSVTICAMVLPIVTPLLQIEVGLAVQWLPLLQRRAIISHQIRMIEIEGDPRPTLSLSSAYETSHMDYHEFVHQFRRTTLKDALLGCYHGHSDYYLASCTAAMEEFCDGGCSTASASEPTSSEPTSSSDHTALHLEAALFCMAEVADQVLLDMSSSTSTSLLASNSSNTNQVVSSTSSDFITSNNKVVEYLQRCTVALAQKPNSLSNLLTLKQACHFVRKVLAWSRQQTFVFDVELTSCIDFFSSFKPTSMLPTTAPTHQKDCWMWRPI